MMVTKHSGVGFMKLVWYRMIQSVVGIGKIEFNWIINLKRFD